MRSHEEELEIKQMEKWYLKKYNIKPLRNNMKRLRQLYCLSHEDVSLMNTRFIKRSTISSWETEQRVPTADNLLSYVLSYGVSMDWLYGITNIPYTQFSVEFAEKKFYQNIAYAWFDDKINEKCFLYWETLTEKSFFKDALTNYCNHETRKNVFSLESRANIVLLGQFVETMTSSNLTLQLEEEGRLYLKGIPQEIINKKVRESSKRRSNRCKKAINNLIKIVNLGNPVFTLS